ncbi:cysteine hydrolase [Ruminococcaceae bacterium OttesenSCG-928-A11]|nr:cysteine hydrolase [Ruminococcaceae bacterium OttesenSCG-928-A11]
MKKLLVVIDYQNDFVSGALGFEGAEKLEPGIIAAVEATVAAGGKVLITRDTHEKDYLETREGRFLPVPHCVRGTAGHQLYGGLHRYEQASMPGTMVIDKATFGSQTIAEAARALCGGDPDEITVCGVATDICVVTNTLILHTAFLGTAIRVDRALCGSGNKAGEAAALALLEGMGIPTGG